MDKIRVFEKDGKLFLGDGSFEVTSTVSYHDQVLEDGTLSNDVSDEYEVFQNGDRIPIGHNLNDFDYIAMGFSWVQSPGVDINGISNGGFWAKVQPV